MSTMPVCSPSLAGLLTRKLPHQHGHPRHRPRQIRAVGAGERGTRYPLADSESQGSWITRAAPGTNALVTT